MTLNEAPARSADTIRTIAAAGVARLIEEERGIIPQMELMGAAWSMEAMLRICAAAEEAVQMESRKSLELGLIHGGEVVLMERAAARGSMRAFRAVLAAWMGVS